MTLTAGTRLGPYEILSPLGAGGMGEVYRARDAKLQREVAIKVLPTDVAADPERLARFEREARVLASLNHPNIAAIYGVEDSTAVKALVLELVEGPTLQDRIESGAIPVDEALAIARQIAEALEAAHEKGIVHRDLKPANVKVSNEGQVKVLDFGLAKALDPAAGSAPDISHSPTISLGTQAGTILGTAAYMSPEQARGKTIDRRADIWAFGVVLYEMLTGKRLFEGETVSDTLAAVLRHEIRFESLPPETPGVVRTLLARCLERDPKKRLRDIGEARIAIDGVGKHDDPAPGSIAVVPIPAAARARWLPSAGSLLAGLLIGGVAVGLWVGRASTARRSGELTQFSIRAPEGTGFVRGLAISPNGRQIAFVARGADGHVALWVRSLDALEARRLPETDDARYPFWAPDSRRIGFFSHRSLKWTDSAGGYPLVVASTASIQDVRGGAWGADDKILYAPSFTGALFVVSAAGGASAPATRLPASGDIGTTRFPSFLPDGRRFVYYASAGSGTEPGRLYLGRLGSLDAKLLGPSHSTAAYAAPGYLVYARGESLVAHRFDDKREELAGEPVPIGVPMGGSLSVSGLRSVAVARSGALVYRSDKRNATQLVWVDRSGRELGALSDADSTWHYAPRLSSDDRLLLVSHYAGQGLGELWVHDLARKLANRVTFDDGDDYMPLWLRPGGREILYNSARPKSPGGIYRIALDRPGQERLWLPGETNQNPVAATPDGRRIVFERDDGQGKLGLWIRDLEGKTEATRLGSSTAIEISADISPDGRWIAYASDATRSWEVYARPLDSSGGVVRISTDGGFQPLWRRDGRELFYVDTNGRLVAVPISLPAGTPGSDGNELRPGAPQILFEARLEESNDRQYDATADGQRFVLNRSVANDSVPMVVVLDWTALLDRKAP